MLSNELVDAEVFVDEHLFNNVGGPSGWIDRGAGELREYHLYGDRLGMMHRGLIGTPASQ